METRQGRRVGVGSEPPDGVGPAAGIAACWRSAAAAHAVPGAVSTAGICGGDGRWALSALDCVNYGAIVVDAQMAVAFANRHARWAMQADHPLQLVGGRLRTHALEDVAALSTAVRQACTQGLRRMLPLHAACDRPRYVTVMPLTDGLAVLWLDRHDVCDTLTLDCYARLHGLTGAETRVLHQLARGDSPNDIAEANGVGLATVRTQVNAIRAKTGTRHMRQLLQEVSCLPPAAALAAPAGGPGPLHA